MSYPIAKFKNNPSNPRIIKDDKFSKLLQSLKTFPEMMEKRPLVCITDADGKLYPIGGNMRLKALKELGYKELKKEWVTLADDWSVEKQKEFLIKDNVGFGEWDWDTLANEWEADELENWGMDLIGFDVNSDEFGEDFSLKDGDKEPFEQITFTLSTDQATQIKNALADIKATEEYKYVETFGNENSNGNALYLIAMQWMQSLK